MIDCRDDVVQVPFVEIKKTALLDRHKVRHA